MRIHLVSPYQSVAMIRMTSPLASFLPMAGYEVTVGDTPDRSADLNHFIPWHGLVEYEPEGGKTSMLYTHCNPPDVGALARAAGKADAVICMSFEGRRELMSLGVDPKKVWVVYSASSEFRMRKRNIGIVAFEQPNARKRSHILVDLAWQADLSPFHFIIRGSGWESVVEKLNGMGVSVDVAETFEWDEMQGLYSSLDLLLVTGYAEGGPLPLLEAMACGVPVLSPRVGYAADLLPEEWLYNGSEELTQKLMAWVKERIVGHSLTRLSSWGTYAEEHSLVFHRLLRGTERVALADESGIDRYAQLLDIVSERRCSSILEIGTWRGDRALQLIQEAAKYTPMERVTYWGTDLFELQTREHLRLEFSKEAYPEEVVRRRLAATHAGVHLLKGDTRVSPDMFKAVGQFDFAFIDGGHSEGTIRSDWLQVSQRMGPDSVVVFDDFYPDRKPDGLGCNRIVEAIDPDTYLVGRLPVRTVTQDGLAIEMVRVSRRDSVSHETEVVPLTATWTFVLGDSGSGDVVEIGAGV